MRKVKLKLPWMVTAMLLVTGCQTGAWAPPRPLVLTSEGLLELDATDLNRDWPGSTLELRLRAIVENPDEPEPEPLRLSLELPRVPVRVRLLDGLQWGRSYEVQLRVARRRTDSEESASAGVLQRFVFGAYPPCPSAKMAQVDANCFWAEQDGGAQGIAWPYASAICGERRSGGHLAQLSSASEVDVVLESSAAFATSRRPQLPKLLWIAAFLNFSADALVSNTDTRTRSSCPAWDATARAPTHQDCDRLLVPLCQLHMQVALAAISELSVDILSPTSAMLEWNMSRNSGWQPRGLKLDIWRIVPDDEAQQPTVRSMVLPPGESHASLTDLEPTMEYRITLCPMEGAQSGCKTVLLSTRAAALEGDQPKKAQIDTKPAMEGSPRPSPAVMVIRIMGCCVVLILTGLTLIVFLTSGTAYPDVVAQIFSEFSIMGAYTCVLMTTTDQRQLTEKQCMVAAVCLQFFFLSTFLFLMLESAYMAKLLVGMFPESLPFNNASVSGAGWGVPAIITGLFAWAFPDKYTRGGQVCWLDLSQVASYSTTVPVGLFVTLQLVFLASVFFSARRRRALTCHEFRRARTQLASKWASLILLASTTLSWATGAAAEQHKTRGLFVCFSVSSIMLGVFVITLRISTEDQVRKKLMTKVGLTTAVRDISSGSSVQTWSRSSPTESDASRANTASTLTSPADSYQNVKIFRN